MNLSAVKHAVALFFFLSLVLSAGVSTAQETVFLYPDSVPGIQLTPLPERVDTLQDRGPVPFVRNVQTPTLTVYRPKSPNGTAVVVCPGGAFRGLAIEKEGSDIARRLNGMGITAFVLKYRVVNAPPDFDPELGRDFGTRNYARIDSINAPFVELAIADGLQAVRYVRMHAQELGIAPDRIGMMGFSAGGALTLAVALRSDAGSGPDFIAPIYAYCSPIASLPVPASAPPAFLAFAADDPIAEGNLEVYQKWHAAGAEIEMHIYAQGGHGFALLRQNLPSDAWMERFSDWLLRKGLLIPLKMARPGSGEGAWAGRQHREEMLHNDWAGLRRYAAENAALGAPKTDEKRVVFFGNSITEGWIRTDPAFFQGKPYIDRGIGGQTTGQMLVRFRQDVIDLQPAVVVILAGVNDIAGNTGETSLETTFGNIVSMVELARANNIKVVLCSVLPAYDFPWAPGLQPAEKIKRLNILLRLYAEQNGCVYVDYHSAMSDTRGGLPPSLAEDGVHPNVNGYSIMEALVEMAIVRVLRD